MMSFSTPNPRHLRWHLAAWRGGLFDYTTGGKRTVREPGRAACMRRGVMVGAVGNVVALLAGTTVEAASFDEVADFYRGKQLRLIIGFDSGGSYDVYARTVARHM